MKKGISILVILLSLSYLADAQEIKWYSFEEAVALSKEKPKKLLIDIYTDWCGWCKKMDAEAYSNEYLIEYVNENYYPVKLTQNKRKILSLKTILSNICQVAEGEYTSWRLL